MSMLSNSVTISTPNGIMNLNHNEPTQLSKNPTLKEVREVMKKTGVTNIHSARNIGHYIVKCRYDLSNGNLQNMLDELTELGYSHRPTTVYASEPGCIVTVPYTDDNYTPVKERPYTRIC